MMNCYLLLKLYFSFHRLEEEVMVILVCTVHQVDTLDITPSQLQTQVLMEFMSLLMLGQEEV